MTSLPTLLLVAGVMVCAVVQSASVQTEVVTNRPTAAPVRAYTIKTLLDPQIGSRNGESSVATPLIQLSACAQAILGCCPPEVKNREECFDQLNCGPHIFGDPCARSFMTQALGGAERFYSQYTVPEQ